MSKKYILELNENQARLVKDALEEYFRIRMGQWGNLADSMARKNIDLSPDNPKHKKIFDDYITTRAAVEKVLECAGDIVWGLPFDNPKSEEQLIAEDIWQAIRYELWKQSPNKDEWCVDSRAPMQMSHEPLPEIKVEIGNV